MAIGVFILTYWTNKLDHKQNKTYMVSGNQGSASLSYIAQSEWRGKHWRLGRWWLLLEIFKNQKENF